MRSLRLASSLLGTFTFLALGACVGYTTNGGGNGGQGGNQSCTIADDCPGEDTYCGARRCDNGVCGREILAPAGTPASTQPLGDCSDLVCDDKGQVTSVANPQDVENDGNPCTNDICDGTTPKHENSDEGTSCGNGAVPLTCDGQGNCIGCMVAADCGPNGGCFTWACNEQQQCIQTPKQNGTPCGLCKACQSGSCMGAPAGQDPGDQCQGADVCTAQGQCGCADGTQNGMETDIDCGGGVCGHCDQGDGCKVDTDCGTNACADGVCCDFACDAPCVACNIDGSVGTCAGLDPGDPDPACGGTQTCFGPATCSCNDDGDCGDPAQACVTPPQGGNLKACINKLTNGDACFGQDNACQSNNCVDGVCCNADCNGPCQTCNSPVSPGTCTSVLQGTDPDSCPNGTCVGGACTP